MNGFTVLQKLGSQHGLRQLDEQWEISFTPCTAGEALPQWAGWRRGVVTFFAAGTKPLPNGTNAPL